MKYNFKDHEGLQIADFHCGDCLALDILLSLEQLRAYESIEIYAKADLIEFLFKDLVASDLDFTFGIIDFEGADICGDYAGEYCMGITSDYEIWIEPAYRHDEKDGEWKLFYSEAALAYVYQEDCGQDMIDNLLKCDVNTLLFGFEEE